MKLYYFNLPGRAESSRIMFRAGGTKFEDVRFADRAEWVEKYKAKSPTGQAPMLELDDGTMIAQSSAIERYAAKAGGFYPEDPVEAAKVDMLVACMSEVEAPLMTTWSLPTVEEKIAAREKMFADGGAIAMKLEIANKIAATKTTEFFISDKLSYADINIFVSLSNLSSGFVDGVTKEMFAKYTALVAIRDSVARHSEIVPIYAGMEEDSSRSSFMP